MLLPSLLLFLLLLLLLLLSQSGIVFHLHGGEHHPTFDKDGGDNLPMAVLTSIGATSMIAGDLKCGLLGSSFCWSLSCEELEKNKDLLMACLTYGRAVLRSLR